MSRALVTPILACLAVGAAAAAPTLQAHLGEEKPLAPEPAPQVTLATTSDAAGVQLTAEPDREAVLASGDRQVRVRLTLAADALEGDTPRVPTDLVIVLDRSGSMDGDKLLDAKAAATELVGQLKDSDRFALVSFSGDARVDVPLLQTSLERDPRRAIDALTAGGGTSMVPALARGLSVVATPEPGRTRRLVLISDGLPDTRDGLVELARTAARAEAPLTTVGIGTDYDETLMQTLADAGTGNFHWTRRGPQLAAVLGDELDTARETVASGLDVALHSESGARIVDAAGYPVVDGRLQLGSLYAGQTRSLWVTVELPPGHLGDLDPGAFRVGWTDAAGAVARADIDLAPIEITEDQGQFLASVNAEAWSDCVVQEDYNALRSEVSAALQRGDADAARGSIARYRAQVGSLNEVVQSAAVVDNLAEVDALEQELEVQLVNPREVQNVWAKGTSTAAYQGRRSGQSKSW